MQKIIKMLLSVLAILAPGLKKDDSVNSVDGAKATLKAVNELSIMLINQFKDGVQVNDFVEMWNKFSTDEAFKAKMEAAWNQYKSIPAELKDIDAGEALELAAVQIEYIPAIVEAFKKEEVIA